MLGLHSAVFTFNELHFFEELWLPENPPKPMASADIESLAAHLFAIQDRNYYWQDSPQQYLEDVRAFMQILPSSVTPALLFETFLRYCAGLHGKAIPCTQTPRNVYYLQEILDLYPRAYVVNMIRDPRAVLLSQKYKWRRNFLGTKEPFRHIIRAWVNYHPVTISLLWQSGIRAGDRFAHHPRVRQVYFEKLVTHPEETLQEICTFLKIDFQSQMLEVPKVGSSTRPDLPDQTGIDTSVTNRWRQGGLNRTEIYICQKITSSEMARHHYASQFVRPNPLLLLYYGVIWGFKIGLAFLFNLNRVQSIAVALQKRLLK